VKLASAFPPGRAVVIAGVAGLPWLVGMAIGTGHGVEAVALLVVALSLAVGVLDWRRSVYGLLAYLPFSGLPIIASYPRTAVAVLAKDVLFVIPAYLGFLISRVTGHGRTAMKSGLAVPLALLSMLALAQAFNPSLPSRLVGAIGVKVWLFYIPLFVLGYHLVRDRRDLNLILTVMSIAAVIPVLIGIAEAVAIYSGREALVYRWYGDAASAVTQDFAELTVEGGGTLRRVSSTFSFVAQYFAFTVSMVAITYAWWRGVLRHTRWSIVGAGLWTMVMLAGLLSGARAAFFFIPLLMAFLFLIERRGARLPVRRLVIMSAVIPTAVALFGANPKDLLRYVGQLAGQYFNELFVEGLRQGLATTIVGLGSGIDTSASRYAFSAISGFSAVGGIWYESWFVKALLELGVAGLLLVVLVFSIMTVGGLRRHRRLRDPDLTVISASLLALIVWNIVYCMKGQYLDIDPMNVYFWLFAGVLAAIPRLDATTGVDRGHG
jgi:hypothetical protein